MKPPTETVHREGVSAGALAGADRSTGGRVFGLLPPLAVIGLIHALSSLEPQELPLQAPVAHFDKWAHVGIYALLLFSFRFWRGRRARPSEWIPGAAIASIVVALGDEWHQSFVPGRSPELLDIVADVVGVGLAAGVFVAWSVFKRHRTLG